MRLECLKKLISAHEDQNSLDLRDVVLLQAVSTHETSSDRMDECFALNSRMFQ
jgi:hypothetical protein